MYTIFLLILAGLFTSIAWRDLRWGLFLIAAALPAYLLRFNILGIPSTFLEVMILAAVAITVFKDRRRFTFHVSRFTPAWRLPILLLLLSAAIGILVSPDLPSALGAWKAYVLEPILLFLVANHVLRNEGDRERLVDALGAGALFVAAAAIAQFAFDAGIPAPWDVERRVTSVFPYPNAVGLYLGPVMVLGAFRLMSRPSHNVKIFWLVTILASALAIVFAQSEAAMAAVPAAVFIASLWSKRLRCFSIPIAIASAAVILAVPALRAPVVQKLTLQDFSGQVRVAQWQETAALLKDKPVFGAGLSGYPIALIPYHTHTQYEIFQYPHNIILNIWVELGVLGLIAFAVLAWNVVREYGWVAWHGAPDGAQHAKGVEHRRGNAMPGPNRLTKLAATFALLEMVIHGLVDVPYFKNDLAVMTWLLLALVAGYAEKIPAENKNA